MRLAVWLLRAFIFFTLFAFALNNEQEVTVRWFFGYQWRAPLVIVVLVALTAGAALGVLAMVPAWWRHRRVARRHAPPPPPPPRKASDPPTVAPSEFGPEHPPREGL
ncbi:LapA family protein [Ideonella sp. DXS22W]|uniref:LapA family protein n=1 Tax=Pseudaquabacterium inlustre TaxID=2984192 RepID=A0ABU9CBE3_9BURK|nr:LapA family protein [Aquabacterium sp. OR-4]MDT7836837.1 LapA family protein [Aquabacterium sp. OR-4]